jgi:hypothetical protein
MELFAFVIVVIIGFVFYNKKKTNNFIIDVVKSVRLEYNFNPDYYQIMANNTGAIAMDFRLKMICIVDRKLNTYYLKNKDILSTEILVDKDVFVQKDFAKTWGKYFLLQSLSNNSIAEASVHISKERHINKINSLKLKIATRNLEKPNHYLLFLKNGNDNQKRKIINDVYDWATRIEALK